MDLLDYRAYFKIVSLFHIKYTCEFKEYGLCETVLSFIPATYISKVIRKIIPFLLQYIYQLQTNSF